MATLLVVLAVALVVGVVVRALLVASEAWRLAWRLSLMGRALVEQAKRHISGTLADPRTTPLS
jgi:hypothetical protein